MGRIMHAHVTHAEAIYVCKSVRVMPEVTNNIG